MWSHWYPILLIIIHIYFLIEYLLKLYTAKNMQSYLLSLENFIDIVTIFPYLVITLSSDDPTFFWNFFVRMLDLLRILTLFRVLKHIEDDFSRELGKIIIGALALVIGLSGYLQLIENRAALLSGDLSNY